MAFTDPQYGLAGAPLIMRGVENPQRLLEFEPMPVCVVASRGRAQGNRI